MENTRYIVVSPAKNEEKFIEKSIRSVVEQSIVPCYYLIVDDGSTDSTSDIIRTYSREFGWIDSITRSPSEWDIGVHYSNVCIDGFSYAMEFCQSHNIDYEYILLLDSDTILEKEYVQKLFDIFSTSKDIGILTGGVYHDIDGSLVLSPISVDDPPGCCRIWRKECFIESGGYVSEVAPDSISNLKARNRGWKIKQIPDVMAIEQRDTSSAMGIWKGFVKNGYFAYRLNLNPLFICSNFLQLFVHHKDMRTFAYLYGYLSSFLRRKDVTTDPEIRKYFMTDIVREFILRKINFFDKT